MAGPGFWLAGEAERRQVAEVLESGYLSRYGREDDPRFKKKVIRLEERFAEIVGVRHALAVNSGTSALMAALRGAGVGPGVEVLVPGYTWVASIGAVILLGAKPVLTEIDESFTMDPVDAAKKITAKTRVIMPVHILGYPSDLERLSDLAAKHGLCLLEDCCQSMGATYRGKMLGSVGDIGAFSLNIFKTLHSGEGGFVTTNRRDFYERCYAFHDQGFLPKRRKYEPGDVLEVGMNMKMNELTAAFILGQLEKLDQILETLRRKKALFKNAIREGGIRNMDFERLHDAGECGVVLTVLFRDAATAQRVAQSLRTRTLKDTGWHNYNLMDQLLAYTYPSGERAFRKHELPRTDDLLARSVTLSVGVTNPGLGAEFGIDILSDEEQILAKAGEFVSTVKPLVE